MPSDSMAAPGFPLLVGHLVRLLLAARGGLRPVWLWSPPSFVLSFALSLAFWPAVLCLHWDHILVVKRCQAFSRPILYQFIWRRIEGQKGGGVVGCADTTTPPKEREDACKAIPGELYHKCHYDGGLMMLLDSGNRHQDFDITVGLK